MENPMSDLIAAVAALEKRLALLEDERAVMRVLATYGPAVDGADAETAANLWTEDGSYDAQIVSFKSRAEIKAMVTGEMHQAIIQGGAAHVIGVPLVHINGDRAVATCYARLYRKQDEKSFYVWRVTAVRWELVRTASGWKVTRRVNKVLDGSKEARDLIRQGLSTS
jgi:ketosteroid isomerase-like protein